MTEFIQYGAVIAVYDPDAGYVTVGGGDILAQVGDIREARAEVRDFFDSAGPITTQEAG